MLLGRLLSIPLLNDFLMELHAQPLPSFSELEVVNGGGKVVALSVDISMMYEMM
tara:strand:+ start:9263 stop:9424 length:162 start_codon:yes stop_codon:yes gene_type:complete